MCKPSVIIAFLLTFMGVLLGGSSFASTTIKEFLPQGEIKNILQLQVKVLFSDPIINTELREHKEKSEKHEIFDIKCPIKGSAHWIDKTTWAYEFLSPLEAGVACSFKLKKDIKNLAGDFLDPAMYQKKFSFSTGGPVIIDQRPYPSDWSPIRSDQLFLLRLDGDYKKESVLKYAHFIVEGIDELIPVKVVEGEMRDKIMKSDLYLFINELGDVNKKISSVEWQKLVRKTVVIGATRRFPNNKKVKLVWGKGVASLSGVTNKKNVVLNYKTEKNFVATFHCERDSLNGPCIPILPMRLEFNASVKTELLKKIKLIPPDGKRVPIVSVYKGEMAQQVSFDGPFEENSTYRLEIPSNIKNEWGDHLSNTLKFPISVQTGSSPSLAKFSGIFGILEWKASPILPITVRKIEKDIQATLLSYEASKSFSQTIKESLSSLTARFKNVATSPVSTAERAKNIFYWIRKVDQDQRDFKARDKSLFGNIGDQNKNQNQKTKTIKIDQWKNENKMEVLGIPLTDPGLYILELQSLKLGESLLGKKVPMFVKTSALVTNMAVHFKWGLSKSMAFVTSLDKGELVSSAYVSIWDCTGKEIAHGDTNNDGVTFFSELPSVSDIPDCHVEGSSFYPERNLMVLAEKKDDFSFTLTSWDKGIQKWQFDASNDTEYDELDYKIKKYFAVHTIFDRTLLRAGETVHMKHLIRHKSLYGLDIPSENMLPKEVIIRHWGTGQSYHFPVTFDKTGISELDWIIPKTAKLGQYAVYLMRGEFEQQAGTFDVQEFRVPLVKFQLQQMSTPWIHSSNVLLEGQLSYFAGGGVDHLPVTFRYESVLSSGIVFKHFKETLFGNGKREIESANVSASEGVQGRGAIESFETQTDDKGGVSLKVPITQKSEGIISLNTVLEYSDPSGEIQSTANHFNIYPATVLVGLNISRWYKDPRDIHFEVATADVMGNPVAGQSFSVDLYQVIRKSHRKNLIGGFYAYENEIKQEKVKTVCEGKTSNKGIFSCHFSSPVSGEIYFEAKTTDANGLISIAHNNGYIVEDSGRPTWDGAEDHERMDILTDKKEYTLGAGEMIKLQVKAPFKHFTALVTVERDGVMDSYVKKVDTSSETIIEIPVKDYYAPNVFISVLALRGRVEAPAPTGMIDLAKPAFKMGLTAINVGWDKNRLDLKVESDKANYKPREQATVKIKVKNFQGTPLHGGEVSVAVVDEGLLELKENRSIDLLSAMMKPRGHRVETSTAQLQVVGKRHFGLKAVPLGGDGGNGNMRELFDTLLFWKARVVLDDKGEGEVSFPVNDSLSSFRVQVVATAGKDLFGNGETKFTTSQDLMIFSGISPVARVGDEMELIYTAKNSSKKDLDLTATLSVSAEGEGLKEPFPVKLLSLLQGNSTSFSWKIKIPESSKIIYQLAIKSTNNISVPISNRIVDSIQTVQMIKPLHPLRVVSSETVQIDKIYATDYHGEIALFLNASLSSLGLKGIQKEMENYPYSCLEQKISKIVVAGDHEKWKQLMSELPSYINPQTKFLSFFANSNSNTSYGSDFLTSYLLKIAHSSNWDIPKEIKNELLQGLKDFILGHTILGSDNNIVWNLEEQKWMALDALSCYEKITPEMIQNLNFNSQLASHQELIHVYNTMLTSPELKNSASLIKEIESEIKNRLIDQGSTVALMEKNDLFSLWRMSSLDSDLILLGVSLLEHKDKNSKDGQFDSGLPKIIKTLLTRNQNGSYHLLTMDKAWLTLLLTKFTSHFESEKVAGETMLSLQSSSKKIAFDWNQKREHEYTISLKESGNIQLSHDGAGKPWVQIKKLSSTPIAEKKFAGISLSKQMILLQRQSKNKTKSWLVGDLVKVMIKFKTSGAVNWLVVNDPIPAGVTILGSGIGGQAVMPSVGESEDLPTYVERLADRYLAYYAWVSGGEYTLSYIMRLNQKGLLGLPGLRVEALYAPEMYGELPGEQFFVE